MVRKVSPPPRVLSIFEFSWPYVCGFCWNGVGKNRKLYFLTGSGFKTGKMEKEDVEIMDPQLLLVM